MSFLKIDPNKRDALVKELLKTKRNIQIRSLKEKVDDLDTQRELEKMFMPITTSQKKTIEEIKKLPTVAIGQSPQAALMGSPTPAIEAPQVDTDLLTYGPLATKYLRSYLGKNKSDTTLGIYNKKR